MIRITRPLSISCLLFMLPLSGLAEDNSLLVPATSTCKLDRNNAETLPIMLSDCQSAAEQGNAQASYELGEYFYTGQYTERDLQKALHWFEQASLRGHAQAQLRLGSMFFRGEGVPVNNIQAYIILKMSSVNGSDEAMDLAERVSESMRYEEWDIANQILGQIFHSYLSELQASEGFTPIHP